MALPGQLRERSSAIEARWLQDTLATYPEDSSAAFRRESDPFGNPVGHALRTGIHAALEALLEGKDASEVCSHLEDVIRVRAVQELAPSQAVSFVFLLKEAVRAELGESGGGSPSASDLAELDNLIDQIALCAFDVYLRYREQVYELRVNEVKRSVAQVVQRWSRRGSPPKTDEDLSKQETS
jgi:hypothetical protein